MNRKLRAIDLYSGVGGWSLGLRLAGIEVVASYERWGPANETNFKNNRHQAQTVDIRRLAFNDLPKNIDVVVGSPPCTQFSFSNRGGSGDLNDGLEDIVKFLTIVNHIRPKMWAMENVPRVATIIENEMKRGGRLYRFRHLGLTPHIVSMEEFGLPQRRRRCIAGNFDFDLLKTYRNTTKRRTLGYVIKSLAQGPAIDPIYQFTLPKDQLWDHDIETPLNGEEIRINKSAKLVHPVYNSMPFPDPLDRSVRTITATCTRVSRESVIIKLPRSETYRRLTVRERASLQGFPITFQFYGSSYGQKLRMVGNAFPPTIAFYLALAFKRVSVESLPNLGTLAKRLTNPAPPPPETRVDRPGGCFSPTRRFRFAIPALRLKSGVRFDLSNSFPGGKVSWQVSFWFGNSKSIQTVTLDADLYRLLITEMTASERTLVKPYLNALAEFIAEADIANMQQLWCHRGPGKTRAFMLLDAISDEATRITKAFRCGDELACRLVRRALQVEYGKKLCDLPGLAKLLRNAPLIASGLLCGGLANDLLSKRALKTTYACIKSAER